MLKFIFLLFSIGMHQVHEVFIGMDYSVESGAFKSIVKLYADDLNIDWTSLSENNMQIDFSEKNSAVNEKLNEYLNTKIELYADS